MPRLRPVRRSSRAGRAGGFSYVEVLLTVLLLSLVVGGILPLLTGGEESYEELRRRQEMIQNARVALDKFLRELRGAGAFRGPSPPTPRSGLGAPRVFGGGGAAPTYSRDQGTLTAWPPPARGDNVFLDYENGST